MTFDEWEKLPPDCDVGSASPDELDRMIWEAAIAAERERLRALVTARMPLIAVYDDQRAVAETLRWVLTQLGDA